MTSKIGPLDLTQNRKFLEIFLTSIEHLKLKFCTFCTYYNFLKGDYPIGEHVFNKIKKSKPGKIQQLSDNIGNNSESNDHRRLN